MLVGMLFEAAKRRPEHPAIVCGSRRLSYGALLSKVEGLAAGLAAAGLRPGDRLALVHGNAAEFVLTFLAAARMGVVVVPRNPAYQKDELAWYFEHCDVRGVVTDPQHVDTCTALLERRGAATPIVATGAAPEGAIPFDRLVGAHATATPAPPTDDADAVFQYSSGSTGRPKRVPRTHGQLHAEAESCVGTLKLRPDDRIFCAVPLFHTHGQGNCMLAAVRSGATLVILEDPNPFILHRARALEVLAAERVTVFPGVPFVFRLLAESSGTADLSALRLCFSAGTALPQATFESFRARFGLPVRQLYGCTEAGALTINLDGDPEATAGSVGRPLRGVDVEVVDEARQPVSTGHTGEIAIATPALTRGYHGMPEINRDAFRGGRFYTGDVGRLDADGRLWITGRKKLFIEVAGNKVDPVEVEDVLMTHPQVREAVVVGVPGAAPGEEIVKAVVVADGPVDQKQLTRLCRERLARYKVPQMVEFRDEIPKSPLGKVLRKYLV
jgi:long-chain acyl-CoA synthetase